MMPGQPMNMQRYNKFLIERKKTLFFNSNHFIFRRHKAVTLFFILFLSFLLIFHQFFLTFWTFIVFLQRIQTHHL